MVMVALRGAAELAATINLTRAGPAPLAEPKIEIQDALLAAVHGHPAEVASATAPNPPGAPKLFWSGIAAYEQAAPSWVMLKLWSLTRMAPDRCDPVLDATV